MHAADLQSGLKRAGFTQRKLAAELGVTEGAVGQVLKGLSRSAKIEAGIAERLKMPLHAVFPQHYAAPDASFGLKESARYKTDGLEDMLLRLFRALPDAAKLRALTLITEMQSGDAYQAKSVVASGAGSVAAGRDVSGVKIGNNVGQVNTGAKVVNKNVRWGK